MPTIDECIKAKAVGEDAKISSVKAVKAAEEFRDQVGKVQDQYGVSKAEAEKAVSDVIIGIREDRVSRRKATAIAQHNVIQDFLNHIKDANGDALLASYGRLSFDPRSIYKGPSLDMRTRVVKGIAHARIEKFLEQFRRRNIGTTQKLDGLDDITSEMMGKGTSNVAAKEMAQAVQGTIDYLLARLQRAGVNVQADSQGLFHRWDSSRVAAVSEEEFVEKVMMRLDKNTIVNDLGLAITDRELADQLSEIYKSIVSRGLNDVVEIKPKPGQITSAAKRESTVLAARQGGGRFLKWTSPEDWMEIHREFGRGNIYEHITSTIDQLSRDVSIAEVLGPHPKATLKRMAREIDKAFAEKALSASGRKAALLTEKIGGPKTQLHALFNVVTGNANVTDQGIVASISQANRNILISSLLGSAFFSGISDSVLTALTARMNGMPIWRTFGRVMGTFTEGLGGSIANKELAINLGFTGLGWSDRAIGAQRVMGEITGDRFTERLADVAMRASLLSPWTEAGRWGFGVEMLNHISMQSGKTFKELDTAIRNSFERHGITPEDWELIRNTEKWVDSDTGARFIRAEDVAAQSEAHFDAANRLQQAIFIETEFAVPASNPRVQARVTGGAPAGTLWGEISRNTAMFKSFPISILFLHWQRAMRKANPISRAEYAAWGFMGLTITGAVGEQLNNIAKGKEPEPVSGDFLMRAIIRGGALGLIGDVLLREQGFGNNIIADLAGPVAQQLNVAIKDLTLENLRAVVTGDDTDVARQLKRLATQSLPGHTLFYARLAMERILLDQAERAVNPKAADYFRRQRKRTRDKQNTEFFAPPGEGLF